MNLTPEQKTILRNWIATQPDKDAGRLATKLNAKHETGKTPPDMVDEPRPAQRVADEQAWLAAGQTMKATVDLIQVALRLTGGSVPIVTGAETEQIDTGSKPVYGQSIAKELDLPNGISWKDIEGL